MAETKRGEFRIRVTDIEDPLPDATFGSIGRYVEIDFPYQRDKPNIPRRLTRSWGLNLDLRRSHGSGQVEGPGGLHLPGLLKQSASTHRPPNRLDLVMQSSARGVEGIMTWTLESLAMVAAGLTRSWSARSRADPARRLLRDSEMKGVMARYRSVLSRQPG
jgi:hypothetical protein